MEREQTMFPAQRFGISQPSSFYPLSQRLQTVLTRHRYAKWPKQKCCLIHVVDCGAMPNCLLGTVWHAPQVSGKHGIRNTGQNFCLFDGRVKYDLLRSKGWRMLMQRSGSQAVACRHHRALKLRLRAKYKLSAAHHLLCSFTHGQVTGLCLTSKYSASFEEAVNIIYEIITFQINIYLFLGSWVHFLFLLILLHTSNVWNISSCNYKVKHFFVVLSEFYGLDSI